MLAVIPARRRLEHLDIALSAQAGEQDCRFDLR
jgi:hypothetical protein